MDIKEVETILTHHFLLYGGITMHKSESSRLNVLYIVNILKKFSDEKRPLTISEVTHLINTEYSYLTPTESLVSTDTVSRTLDALIHTFFDTSRENYLSLVHDIGFSIFCVMKSDHGFVTYHKEEDKKAPQKYFYYQSSFSNAEVTTLIDAVETHNYFSDEELSELIDKLISIQPVSYSSEKYIHCTPTVKDDNSILFSNIDFLDQIIDDKKCAQITYCYYNHKKELVPRPGYPKIIEPISLMWSNGYYYLVAFHPERKQLVNYRIDRITDIDLVDATPTHKPKEFNASQYRLEHPVMYAGSSCNIVLLCRETATNNIMNLIMDSFGQLVKIHEATDAECAKYIRNFHPCKNEKWYKVSFISSVGGTQLWVLQNCKDCMIIEPISSYEYIKSILSDSLNMYRDS